MKIRRMSTVLAAFAAVAAAGVMFASCQAPGALLYGRVTSTTGTHVAGIQVAVYSNSTDDVVAQTTTDSDGDYSFLPALLPSNNYRIRFGTNNWWNSASGSADASSWAGASPVAATVYSPAVINATVDVATGSVTGTVFSADQPVAGATVAAKSTASDATIATTTTATDGTYTFAALPAGSYVFKFTATGLTTRYNNSSQLPGAPVVTVTGGAAITGIDTTLDAESTITGTVTDGTNPLPDILVVAYFSPVNGGGPRVAGPVMEATMTASDGTFTLAHLNAISYTVAFGDPAGHMRTLVYGTTSTNPGDGTVVYPHPTVDLGTVTLASNTAPSAPSDVTATVGDSQATVSWTAPDNGGSPITSYTVTSTPGSKTCASTNARNCTVAGLVNGTAYTFTATATNAIGTSAPSAPSAATMLGTWQMVAPLQGQVAWTPSSVSDSGMVTGATSNGQGVIYGSGFNYVAVLNATGYSSVVTNGMTTVGEVVGTGKDASSGAWVGLVWQSVGATPTALPLGSYESVSPFGVSPSGVIFGSGYVPGVGTSGLVWSSSTAAPTTLLSPGYYSVQVVGVTATGEVVATAESTSTGDLATLVWSSATALPTVLSAPGHTGITATGVTQSGEIFGTATDTVTGNQVGLVWPSATATPTALDSGGQKWVNVIGMSSIGEIVGIGGDSPYTDHVGLVWSSPTVAPATLDATGYSSVSLTGVAQSGKIFGTGTATSSGDEVALTWPSATANPATLPTVEGSLPTSVVGVSAAGQLVGTGNTTSTNAQVGVTWASPTAYPVALPATGYTNVSVAGVSPSGVIFGTATDTSTTAQVALVWASSSVAPVALSGTGYTNVSVAGVSPSGVVFGTATDTSTSAQVGLTWASSSSAPVALPATGYTNVAVTGVSTAGEIVGTGHNTSSGNQDGLVWATATATPTVLNSSGNSTVQVTGISPSGVIYGTASNGTMLQVGLVWSSATASPSVLPGTGLPGTSGLSFDDVHVTGVTQSGEIVGYASDINSSGRHVGLVWSSVTANPVEITAIDPVTVAGVTPAGQIFGTVGVGSGFVFTR